MIHQIKSNTQESSSSCSNSALYFLLHQCNSSIDLLQSDHFCSVAPRQPGSLRAHQSKNNLLGKTEPSHQEVRTPHPSRADLKEMFKPLYKFAPFFPAIPNVPWPLYELCRWTPTVVGPCICLVRLSSWLWLELSFSPPHSRRKELREIWEWFVFIRRTSEMEQRWSSGAKRHQHRVRTAWP